MDPRSSAVPTSIDPTTHKDSYEQDERTRMMSDVNTFWVFRVLLDLPTMKFSFTRASMASKQAKRLSVQYCSSKPANFYVVAHDERDPSFRSFLTSVQNLFASR